MRPWRCSESMARWRRPVVGSTMTELKVRLKSVSVSHLPEGLYVVEHVLDRENKNVKVEHFGRLC